MKHKKETKHSIPLRAESNADSYVPTPTEVEALKGYAAAREKCAPRIKITGKQARPDHPSLKVAQIALMRALGTTDTDFYSGLLGQLVNIGSPGQEPDEAGINFMLAIVKGTEPRNPIEAMLAAHMGAVHLATMTFARQLAHAKNTPQQDLAERTFNKLARTFAMQVATLKNYRSKGEQKMTVQHVHIADGGQAIVANVNTSAEGGGARQKSGEQPHALGYAPGETLPRDLKTKREAVSSASDTRP